MHEFSIASSIIRRTEKLLSEKGLLPGGTVSTIKVRVGDMSGVDRGVLADCLAELIAGSALSGARLDVLRQTAGLLCGRCGRVEAPEPFRLACPVCGGVPRGVEGGQDIFIESVEVETDD